MEIQKLNFDMQALRDCHMTHEHSFLDLVKKSYPQAKYVDAEGRQLIYINNNSPVLAIAHLDITMGYTHFSVGEKTARPGHTCIFSPAVDDRLGAFTILHLLPQLSINCDILLSEGEEVGDPTSRYFSKHKQYNWMFQFDRMGTDVVHYQYTGSRWLRALYYHFTKVNRGSFSDISFMGHLGCQGVNIGTGYHDYTWENAWASLDELASQVWRFNKFYKRFKDIHFRHDGSKRLW